LSDFTAANILLQLANIDEWTIDEIHERLGVPQTRDLHRIAGGVNELSGPRYTVNAISMKMVDPQWLSDQIMIIDFGIAFLKEQSSNDIGTPKAYCAPEFNFHSPRSCSSDIWALGCTIFEIRTGTSLFRYKGPPTRDQILISMIQVLGTLPDIWWKEWKGGRNWYDVEIKDGGELAGNLIGTLFRKIMQIGLHDGDAVASLPTNKGLDFKKLLEGTKPTQLTSYDLHRDSTNRLLALVEELTTSEAADVMELVNKPSSGSSQERSQEKSSSGSGNKNQTGSGSGSGSSGMKSSEKSIPSEGISTGKVDSGTGTGTETEGQVGAGVALDKFAGIAVEDFLESSGTIISVAEAAGLENLLRTALAFLPGKRLPADKIARHHWFSDKYELAATN
jgi:serine/threonine protein kinase